jgi:hypothetical protein
MQGAENKTNLPRCLVLNKVDRVISEDVLAQKDRCLLKGGNPRTGGNN